MLQKQLLIMILMVMDLISEGDKLTYTITVENNGNITLRSLYVTDVITDIASNTRNLDNSNFTSCCQ